MVQDSLHSISLEWRTLQPTDRSLINTTKMCHKTIHLLGRGMTHKTNCSNSVMSPPKMLHEAFHSALGILSLFLLCFSLSRLYWLLCCIHWERSRGELVSNCIQSEGKSHWLRLKWQDWGGPYWAYCPGRNRALDKGTQCGWFLECEWVGSNESILMWLIVNITVHHTFILLD